MKQNEFFLFIMTKYLNDFLHMNKAGKTSLFKKRNNSEFHDR